MKQEQIENLRAHCTEKLREMADDENEYLRKQNDELKSLLNYIADETHPEKCFSPMPKEDTIKGITDKF